MNWTALLFAAFAYTALAVSLTEYVLVQSTDTLPILPGNVTVHRGGNVTLSHGV